MKKYEEYVLISDLDGTLIRSDKTISSKNKEAIQAFIAGGGYFTVATGRTAQNVLPYLEGIAINKPCILYNGGALYNLSQKEFLLCNFLQKDPLFDYVKWILDTYQSLCVQIFTVDKLYVVNTNQLVDPVIVAEKQEFQFEDIEKIWHKEWLKIILNGSHEELLECNKHLKELIEKNIIHSVFSVPTYLEILPFGVSKGKALEELVKIEKLDQRKTIAIGDYDNDIEMLKIATVGIAPLNASKHAKASADLLTVSNDQDAIFEVIMHILPKLK
ncbi:MAG: Cof-like hydrolase [Clostridia bacterium]|nr:Cof-like hydrolase [Clostridia bacterium]